MYTNYAHYGNYIASYREDGSLSTAALITTSPPRGITRDIILKVLIQISGGLSSDNTSRSFSIFNTSLDQSRHGSGGFFASVARRSSSPNRLPGTGTKSFLQVLERATAEVLMWLLAHRLLPKGSAIAIFQKCSESSLTLNLPLLISNFLLVRGQRTPRESPCRCRRQGLL